MKLAFIVKQNSNFDEFLKSLLQKINKKGFFVANFLGKEDDWNESKTTIEKEKLKVCYKKEIELTSLEEEAKTISEAESIINLQQNKGQNVEK